MNIYHHRIAVGPLVLAAVLSLLTACDDSGTDHTRASTTPIVPTDPISLASMRGCQLDSDCAADLFCFQSSCVRECVDDTDCGTGGQCTARSRCVDTALAAEREERVGANDAGFLDDDEIALAANAQGEIGVVQGLPSIVNVDEGEQSVTLSIITQKPVPQGRILYRIELDGHTYDENVYIAEGSDHFELVIPTGNASQVGLTASESVQFAYVVTSVGGFDVTMRPAVRESGIYKGEVTMDAFGTGGLPIQMGIRLTPESADLENAVTRELILPVSGADLFSPEFSLERSPSHWISRPLEYDVNARAWVAQFAEPFRLPSGMLFGQRENIVRSLRIEITHITDNVAYGAIADRWEGLYAERSADGVTSMAPVRLQGRLTVERVGRLTAAAHDARAGEASYPAPPLIPPLMTADACTEQLWSQIYAQIGSTDAPDFPCARIDSLDDLFLTKSDDAAACVAEGAYTVLGGSTTAGMIRAFMDPQQENPGGLSFDEFLSRCAAQDGYCVPSAEVLCMTQLVAATYQRYDYSEANDAAAAASDIAVLLDLYQQLSRESYLGMELSAYQRDTQTRLDWLRTAIAPLFLASELRRYNDDIMVKWERDVLQAHYNTLRSQYGPADLAVLARVPTEGAAQAARRALLLEMTQSWQGTMDALVLASQRWNDLHQNDVKRANATATIQRRLLELYLSAGVLSQLNASAGSSIANAQFGSGFSNLSSGMAKLSKPFTDLLFYRDAEVVVSRSVDPSQNAQTLLVDKETLARQAIRDAQTTVDRVLADAQANDVTEAVLKDQMYTQLDALRTEIVTLCGVPRGCDSQDVGTVAGCDILTTFGSCGTGVHPSQFNATTTDAANLLASDAGKAILDVQSAAARITTIAEEHRAVSERIDITFENARAFQQKLRDWDSRRRQVNQEIRHTLQDIQRLKNSKLQQTAASIAQVQTLRERAYQSQAAAIEQWSKMEYDGNQEDYEDMRDINYKRMRANNLGVSADLATNLADAFAEGVASPIKMGILLAGAAASVPFLYSAVDQEHQANRLEAQLEYQQAMRASKVTHLRALSELNTALSQDKIDALADELRLLELETDADIQAREALIDGLRRNLEADLAYEKDLQELRDRQTEAKRMATERAAIDAQITQAMIGLNQRALAYEVIVQRAQLLEGSFNALNTRARNLEQLMGSPAVIFAFANRLASAEARLERAKSLIFDWLVALEYYAVRPFADQRMAVTLARNPSQLEAIANDLLRLSRVCGGMVNYETVDVSVRDQFLRMNRAVNMSLSDGHEVLLHPAERFRALLQRGNIPLNIQTRYTADERVGDLMNNRRVLALSFPIRLSDFANLPQTCNAKVASVAVQLVGENLNGGLLPVVSVLYDGTSELVSCQPNIEQIVGALDPGATAFDLITRFRTAGRSVSPVARINAYGPDSTENRGLEGLPLSSTYTLLIDPSKGDNRTVNWDALEDIRLKITYAYQDVFPEDQCQ